MSAPRRGFRVALLGTACAVLSTAGCRVGYDPARSPSATSPLGIVVALEWDTPGRAPGSNSGELLGMDEQGVYLLHPGAVALYPFGTPLELQPRTGRPDALDLRSADASRRQAFAQYARYPFGMDQGTLGALLGALQMDSVVVRRRP